MKLLIGLLAAAALAGCGTIETPSVAITANIRQLVEAEVLANLKDPESARFDPRVHAGENQWGRKSGFVVCGHVNAKNSYGGYGGSAAYAVQYDPHTQKAEFLAMDSPGKWSVEYACRNIGAKS